MKRVYLFYLTDNRKEYPAISSFKKGKYSLYAWTTRKEIKRDFSNHRNMELFICIKQNMDDVTFSEFSKKYENWLLEYRRLSTKIVDNKRYIKNSVCVLAPASEIDMLRDDTFHELDNVTYIDPLCFKDSFGIMLRDIFKINEVCKPIPREDDLPWYAVEIDWLGVYCHLFNNTYK